MGLIWPTETGSSLITDKEMYFHASLHKVIFLYCPSFLTAEEYLEAVCYICVYVIPIPSCLSIFKYQLSLINLNFRKISKPLRSPEKHAKQLILYCNCL